VATADVPAGPFRDRGMLTRTDGTVDPVRGPIGCGDSAGYSNIDPAPFVDSVTGNVYLYLSTGHDASGAWNRKASVIPLAADRIRASGSRRALFSATRSWESGVIEGPWMHKRNSTYYLFYSSGSWTNASYAMGYATSSSPNGTFAKASANPILKSTADVVGPGGGSVTTGPHCGDWMVYHGRTIAAGPRTLRIDPLVWNTAYVPPAYRCADPRPRRSRRRSAPSGRGIAGQTEEVGELRQPCRCSTGGTSRRERLGARIRLVASVSQGERHTTARDELGAWTPTPASHSHPWTEQA
jgi:hypothetical protein